MSPTTIIISTLCAALVLVLVGAAIWISRLHEMIEQRDDAIDALARSAHEDDVVQALNCISV